MAFGYAGARMQPIADEAGVNKALLHYYYKNKEGLFKKVWGEEAEKMLSSIEDIAHQKIPILEKIRKLIENDIIHLLKNPDMPMFMMREMARDSALIEKFDPEGRGKKILAIMAQEIQKAQREKIIRKDIDIQDIFINIGGLAMFPFIAKAYCRSGANMSEKKYIEWLNERKKTVPDFIIRAIKI